MNGYYFPFLILKRNEGSTFASLKEEIIFEKEVLKKLGIYKPHKFFVHLIEAHGLLSLIHFFV